MDEVSKRIIFLKRTILFIALLIIFLIICIIFVDNPITRTFNVICIVADIWAMRKNIGFIKKLKRIV